QPRLEAWCSSRGGEVSPGRSIELLDLRQERARCGHAESHALVFMVWLTTGPCSGLKSLEMARRHTKQERSQIIPRFASSKKRENTFCSFDPTQFIIRSFAVRCETATVGKTNGKVFLWPNRRNHTLPVRT